MIYKRSQLFSGLNQSTFLDTGEEDRSQMPFSLRSSLAEIISETLVKMIFDDNYVHCDIDERNVLVQVKCGNGDGGRERGLIQFHSLSVSRYLLTQIKHLKLSTLKPCLYSVFL